VHLGFLGHPVVGDTLYGAPREIRVGKSGAISLSRNFLHSAQLSLFHPRTGEQLSFKAPLPQTLETFLAALERKPANNGADDHPH
jgi:23S rRNA pseudouridine1911/1915/1917 synthase